MMNVRLCVLVSVLVTAIFVFVTSASAQEVLPRDNGIFEYHQGPDYRESESHPLRTVAYALHPVGWLAREVVYRPLSSVMSSTRFTRSFFGYRDPFDYRDTHCFNASQEIYDCTKVPPQSRINSDSVGSGDILVDGGSGSQSASVAQVHFPDVAFEFDRAKLNALGQGRVRQIAQLLAADPELSVSVEGHADARGSDDYNAKLGQARADKVLNELVELGIDPARLAAATKGETQPIFTEDEEWARAVNRRVAVVVGG